MAAINQEGVEGVRKWESLFPANCNQDIWPMPLESKTSLKAQKGRTLYITVRFCFNGVTLSLLSKRIESSTQSTPTTYCLSQPSMVHWLISSIFPCLPFVRLSCYGNTRPNLTSIWPRPLKPIHFLKAYDDSYSKMNREHKYKDKDEYKDNDKDKDAERLNESLTVCYILGILTTQAFQV